MIINGVELQDLDIYDLEVAEKFDKELKVFAGTSDGKKISPSF